MNDLETIARKRLHSSDFAKTDSCKAAVATRLIGGLLFALLVIATLQFIMNQTGN